MFKWVTATATLVVLIALGLSARPVSAIDNTTYLVPNVDSTPLQWTATGCVSHFDCVDEWPNDGATSYLTYPLDTDIETLGLTDGDVSPSAVISRVVFEMAARTHDGSRGFFQASLIVGPSTCAAIVNTITTTWTVYTVDCTQTGFTPALLASALIRFDPYCVTLCPPGISWVSATRVQITWNEPAIQPPPDPDKYPLAGDIFCTVAWPWDMTARCIAKERMQTGLISIREWWWDGELVKRTEDRHSGIYLNVTLTGLESKPWVPLNVSHSVTFRAYLFNGQMFETRGAAAYDSTLLWVLYGAIIAVAVVARASRYRAKEPHSEPPKREVSE